MFSKVVVLSNVHSKPPYRSGNSVVVVVHKNVKDFFFEVIVFGFLMKLLEIIYFSKNEYFFLFYWKIYAKKIYTYFYSYSNIFKKLVFKIFNKFI